MLRRLTNGRFIIIIIISTRHNQTSKQMQSWNGYDKADSTYSQPSVLITYVILEGAQRVHISAKWFFYSWYIALSFYL